MDENIEKLVNRVTERYKRSLNRFRACRPGSEMLEQNLITLLSHEFLKMFDEDDNCVVYSEIPFKSVTNSQNWSSRLDGFLANSDAAYLVEAKSSRHKDYLISDIKADLDRIHSKELEESFIEMASKGDSRTYQFPRDVYGLIIADFWSLSDKTPWFTAAEFETSILPEHSVKAKVEKVGTFGRYDYFLVVAHTEKLEWGELGAGNAY